MELNGIITTNTPLNAVVTGGIPGFSPIATVEQTQSGATITITDKNGTTTANILNGTATDAQVETAVDAWLDDNVAQETGYVLDSSLTMSNAAAPADKVGELKSEINSLGYGVFNPVPMTSSATSSGWRLNESNGFCHIDDGYKFVKYQVEPGMIVHIVSDDRFQFQTVANVPTGGISNRVGATYGVGSYYLTVPDTANYLIVSTPSSSNAYAYYTVMKPVDLIDDYVFGVNRNFLAVGNKTNVFFVSLKSGYQYKYTNGTSAAQTLGYLKSDGTTVSISGNLSSGGSITFVPADDYIGLKGWFNAGGTVSIVGGFSLLHDTENNLDSYINGINKEITFEASIQTRYFPIPFIRGKEYTFVSHISQACSVAIKKGLQGSSVSVSDHLSTGGMVSFVVPDEGYTHLAVYSTGTGTFEIRGSYKGRNGDSPWLSLVKWHDGNVYLGLNGVPQGEGIVIPGVKDSYLDGYTLLFEDDFEGDALDTDSWAYELGYKRNDEPQVYKQENVSVANSNLIITAKREPAQAIKGGVLTDFDWTSGSIYFNNSYSFKRVEAKILFPKISGAFPAFWGVGNVGDYPACGEIDIVEGNCFAPNYDSVMAGAYYTDSNNVQKSVGRFYTSQFDQNGYHIYALERSNGKLSFFIDGNLMESFSITEEMSEFNNSYRWILNLALSPVTSRIPASVDEYEMYVDWFRIYA